MSAHAGRIHEGGALSHQERREDKRNAILRTPVTDFELSVRSRNCLAKMGIRTLGESLLPDYRD